jgi:DNA-binding response OmpR family regulator
MSYVSRLRAAAAWSPIILMSAFGGTSAREAGLSLGVSAYFDKPLRLSALKIAVERLLGSVEPLGRSGRSCKA